MRKGRYEQWEKDLIKEMRNYNKGYNEIAQRLNRSKDSIGVYCRRNNLDGYKAKSSVNPDKAYEYFLKSFNTKYGDRYLYIGGYTHSDDDVIIECKKCHRRMNMGVQSIRKKRPLHCQCEIEQRIYEREIKKALIYTLVKIQKEKHREEQNRIEYELRQKDLISVCKECGKVFKGDRIGMKYCSDICSNRMNNRNKEKARMHKIIANGEIDKDITLSKLIKKDNNICHICGEKCDRKDYTKAEEGHFIVGKSYPSIDHVLPISKGGTHTWDNIKLAHHYCNTIKNNKGVYEERVGQLKMVM